MNNLLRNVVLSIILIVTSTSIAGQTKKESVYVKTPIFEVWYNEVYEQPMKLIYKSENRETNVNRGSMDFKTEKLYHTSDSKDYYKNIYDKGHLAPAAAFSDNMVNLKQTFSYLNCALQEQTMNRVEWRLLESQERKWDDEQTLVVTINLIFDEGHEVLPTGGHIPTRMVKHIFFTKDNIYKCFDFENIRPTKGWEEHEVTHKH